MAEQDRADAERTFSQGQPSVGRGQTKAAEPRTFTNGAEVDLRAIGEADRPENDWGEPLGDDGVAYGANHTRRPVQAEAERRQGSKTRARTKDILSRRD